MMPDVLIETQLDGLKDKCPAFQSGCPYAGLELNGMMKEMQQCLEFKDKCPFKNAGSLSEVYERIGKVSTAKLSDGDKKGLVELINSIHSISKELSNTVGECPVFSTDSGCPFKSLCTDGNPLLNKIEALSWNKVVGDAQEAIEKNDIALSKEFKSGTKKIHREAERVHFVRDFLKGNVDETLYRAFVASLYFIYRALETESRKCADHPMFCQIHFPEQLERVESLEKDLQYYYGDDWRDEITMSDVVSEYVDHIHDIARKDPVLLISHHYTRYLGDLSGGQVLKKAAVKACCLPATGEGVEFYEFRNVDSAGEFKTMYRKKLDSIQVSKGKAEALVEEAKVAFMFNIKLFKELDMLGGFMEEISHETTESEETPKSDVCPFMTTKKNDEKYKGSVASVQKGKCPMTALKRNSNRIVLFVSVAMLAIAMLFAFGVRPVGRA